MDGLVEKSEGLLGKSGASMSSNNQIKKERLGMARCLASGRDAWRYNAEQKR
jgi:hypothetical protein